MAFYHVGGCSCPEGCCDCGDPSPPVTHRVRAKLKKFRRLGGPFNRDHEWRHPSLEAAREQAANLDLRVWTRPRVSKLR
jgi:hypothetical protein